MLLNWLRRDRPRSATARFNVVFRYLMLVVATVAGFALVPLYLRYIPTRTYGYWLSTGYFLSLLVSIDPGLTTILQQRVAQYYARREFDALRTYVSGGLAVSGVIALTVLSIGLAVRGYVPGLLHIETPADRAMIARTLAFAVAGTSLSFFSFSVAAVNQGLQSSVGTGSIVLFANIASPVLSVFLLGRGYGVDGISIPMFVNGALLASLQLTYLFLRLRAERIALRFSIANVREIIGTLSLTFFGRTASIGAANLDSVIVARFVSPEALVSLVITKKAFDYGRELINQLVVSLQPTLAHLVASQDSRRAAAVVLRLVTICLWTLGFLLGGLISLNAEFVHIWVPQTPFLGQSYNLLLALALAVTMTSASLTNVGMSFGHFGRISRGMVVQAVLSVMALIVGTKFFGVAGAILAPVVAILLYPLHTYLGAILETVSFSAEDRRRMLVESLKAAAVTTGLVIATSPLSPASWSSFFLVGLLYSAGFALLALASSTTLRNEARAVFGVIGARLLVPARAWSSSTRA